MLHNAAHRSTVLVSRALLALALVAAPFAGAEPLAQTVAGSGVKEGLCVVLPAGDGAALGWVTKDGRFVVQGLALGETEVATIRAAIPAAIHGLASVRAWTPGEALPYADHLVNLLVVDADALGALAMAGDDWVIGGQVTNSDKGRERQAMPFRLRILSEASGEARQEDLPLPAKPVYGGISRDDGRIFVVTRDGSLTVFGP